MEFGWEPVEALLKDASLRDLIAEYWEELSPLKGIVPLDVDYEKMAALEKMGLHRVWVARDDGALAGLIGFYIQPHINYRSTLFAFDNGHYLSPPYRDKDWAGIKMWRAACDALRGMGVKIVVGHDNVVHPLDPFFKRLDFQPRSTLFWRVL